MDQRMRAEFFHSLIAERQQLRKKFEEEESSLDEQIKKLKMVSGCTHKHADGTSSEVSDFDPCRARYHCDYCTLGERR